MKQNQNIGKANINRIKTSIGKGYITYTCTNHPEIILNEPGLCPECGKDLVKKY